MTIASWKCLCNALHTTLPAERHINKNADFMKEEIKECSKRQDPNNIQAMKSSTCCDRRVVHPRSDYNIKSKATANDNIITTWYSMIRHKPDC